MSELDIDNEGMVALWDGLRIELEHLVAPKRLPHLFLEMTARRFLGERTCGSDDVFVFTTAPASGAGKHVLRVGVSRSFHRFATCAAKDAVSVKCH